MISLILWLVCAYIVMVLVLGFLSSAFDIIGNALSSVKIRGNSLLAFVVALLIMVPAALVVLRIV